MEEHENDSLLDLVRKTVAADKEVSTSTENESGLTFKRDEKGVLWSYDVKTGEKVGQIFEHGNDDKIDTIKEV